MTSSSSAARSRHARLTVDESRIQNRLWHTVDLDQLSARLHGGAHGAVRISACLAGASAAALADRPAPRLPRATIPFTGTKRVKRVPASAFVTIGRETAPAAVSPAPSANDNHVPRPSQARMRFALRDVLMLAALAASLAGAFYSGRLHAAQTVIVVPTASSPRNAVT
jgi:hypothetical protein